MSFDLNLVLYNYFNSPTRILQFPILYLYFEKIDKIYSSIFLISIKLHVKLSQQIIFSFLVRYLTYFGRIPNVSSLWDFVISFFLSISSPLKALMSFSTLRTYARRERCDRTLNRLDRCKFYYYAGLHQKEINDKSD
jgi:hypothetical protein